MQAENIGPVAVTKMVFGYGLSSPKPSVVVRSPFVTYIKSLFTWCLTIRNKYSQLQVLDYLFISFSWGYLVFGLCPLSSILKNTAKLWAGWSGFGSWQGQEISFILYSVHIGSGAHAAYYPLGVKWLGHEADHSPLSSAEVKNGGTVLPLPITSSWHGS
jgi:hypothetical protein